MLLFRMKQPPQKEAIPLIKHIAKQIKFCAVIGKGKGFQIDHARHLLQSNQNEHIRPSRAAVSP